MSFLAFLGWRRRAGIVLAALDAAGAAGEPVVVLGAPRLARALARRGREATLVTSVDAEGSLGALVAGGNGPLDAGICRALRPGGALVLFSTLPAAELSRRALCAGLVDIEQRRAGRYLVTSGRVWGPRRETAR
jgi:hypothetical protein